MSPAILELNIEDVGRSFADRLEVLRRIEIQMKVDSETATQRRRDQSLPGCGANQSELRQLELDRARTRALPDQKIETEVFHRRIKFFFERGEQAMNLVDEEHVAFLQIRQQRRNIASLLNRRT